MFVCVCFQLLILHKVNLDPFQDAKYLQQYLKCFARGLQEPAVGLES